MKNFARAMNTRFVSTAWMAVIIGSLCFSVGEGLRLTPFPVSALTQHDEGSDFVVKASERNSLSQYGPLDVPAQPQKRSKRQVLDLACPGSAGACKIVGPFCDRLEYEAVDAGCLLFVPRPGGRAPPSFS